MAGSPSVVKHAVTVGSLSMRSASLIAADVPVRTRRVVRGGMTRPGVAREWIASDPEAQCRQRQSG